LLVSSASSALFPGRNGQAKRIDTLSHQIKDLIRKELGIEWTPHNFRHSSVRILMRAHPGDYETPRRILGHSSAEMLRRAYDAEETRPALDLYDALIESILDPDTSNSDGPKSKGKKKRKV
jgi:integrase